MRSFWVFRPKVQVGLMVLGVALGLLLVHHHRTERSGFRPPPVPFDLSVVNLQNSFKHAWRNVSRSVVFIRSYERINRKLSREMIARDDTLSWYTLMRGLLSFSLRDVFQEKAVGSGILLDRRGYILTNLQLVDGVDRIFVRVNDSREYTARVVGIDWVSELAVLKIPGGFQLHPAPIGDSGAVLPGEWVMAIGNPFGLQQSMTIGVVSGINRHDFGFLELSDLIQTDVRINPGNTGGPLLNLRGEVIGINAADDSSSKGDGFAIPINTGLSIAEKLIRDGRISRGWMGIGMQNLTPHLAKIFRVPAFTGVVVSQVFPDGPSDKAGLRPGDVIIAFDGSPVRSPLELRRRVVETRVGKEVVLSLFREGEVVIRNATIGNMQPSPSETVLFQ